MQLLRVKATIKGRVQGVFYRQSTKEAALNHKVTGWVRNLPNGDVEAVFEGPKQAVHEMLSWCKQGPPAARVDEILVDWESATGEFIKFSVR